MSQSSFRFKSSHCYSCRHYVSNAHKKHAPSYIINGQIWRENTNLDAVQSINLWSQEKTPGNLSKSVHKTSTFYSRIPTFMLFIVCHFIPHIALGYVRNFSTRCLRLSNAYRRLWAVSSLVIMMTSSNGSIFCVTGHLCGEFTSHRWITSTKAIDAELLYFLWSAPE